MMKKWLFMLGLGAMVLHPFPVQSSEPMSISLELDSVDIGDIVKLFTRLTPVSLLYDPNDFRASQPVDVHLKNEPWLPALQSILASRGFVLLAEPEGRNNYSIIKTDRPDVAARIQYASAAVSLADAVLADIRSNNVASATARLETFAACNRQTVKAFEASQKKTEKESANKASESSVAPAQQIQR